jgi:hypothetical protein
MIFVIWANIYFCNRCGHEDCNPPDLPADHNNWPGSFSKSISMYGSGATYTGDTTTTLPPR